MKVNELMVWDWVQVKRGWDGHLTTERIKGVIEEKDNDYPITLFTGETCSIDDIVPIPLTEDILVKYDFFVTTNQYKQEVWKMKGHELVVVESGFYIHLFGAMCRIDYLHQLQQLIRIMGIEKEIEL